MQKTAIKIPSYAAGQWQLGSGSPVEIFHAVSGEKVYEAGTDGLDFAGMLRWAAQQGGPRLRAMTFHQRALMLKNLALYLSERKDEFYPLSAVTGATRGDSWIDIEGGIGTLFTYASKGRRELPDEPFYVDGSLERISKNNTFAGHHICVPLEGAAVHINAFNFPCWGMLEKLAPTLLAGMPAIVKPATSTCYLAQAMAKAIIESEILPAGALQIVCGGLGDLLDHLSCQDVVTLTGSKTTGAKLKQHPRLIEHAVRFNLEADSLNCTVLGPEAAPGRDEFELFIKEIVKEITVKAGQKCTSIRRIIVPRAFEQEVLERLRAALAETVVGDPAEKGVRMGPLVSKEQVQDVSQKVADLKKGAEIVSGGAGEMQLRGADPAKGAFFPQTLLYCAKPFSSSEVHQVEAFGPVSTVMPYTNLDEAVELARLGAGSLCASVFTADDDTARALCLGLAPYHGRILLMNSYCAKESTGHGSPLPHLVHGGPGRAGGGEELGGIRSVLHYMQRTAIQGSPQRLTRICNQWLRGSDTLSDRVHPFRKYYDELQIGESFLTHRRTITEADVINFAGISGDYFYAHVDELAAKESVFGNRVAHGYLVLAVAAGLFVSPAPGPVIANYGLENLRFIKPVYIGDTIQVRLTCKQKTPRDLEPKGVVAWDVDVFNQVGDSVALYTILTLVERRVE